MQTGLVDSKVAVNQMTLEGIGLVPEVDTTSTFSDNLSLPIHRWFRYSAGFSALWVRKLIDQEKAKGTVNVLDP
jgi:hypothetical protein